MVTLATHKTLANGENRKVDVLHPEAQITENRLNELRFKLANNLQSSLELESTLNTFFQHVQKIIGCSGMHYFDDEKHSDIFLGVNEKHSANYNVSSDKDQLGELKFLRAHKFAEPELAILEMFIGVLFFPLRNALKYKQALDSSFKDALTGVGNRSALEFNFAREIKLAQRHKTALAILVIDIDHFKNVNDTHGHRCGDIALRNVAESTSISLRETDQVFRYGGEEFVVMLNSTDMANALLTAERIRSNIANQTTSAKGKEVNVTVSIGIATLSLDDTFDDLFERADQALYRAKHSGRNQVVCSDSDLKTEIKRSA